MDEPDWQLWRSFLAVIQTGTLSAAARRLGLTQPTLGRQIATLEQIINVTLFTRSTEGLKPTERAAQLLPHAAAMAASASALTRAASGADEELRGAIRLAASEFVGIVVLPEMVARFQEENPGIEVELVLSDKVENLLRRDADLAVRNIAPAQNALLAKRVGDVAIKFFAHREYLDRHGVPASIAQLATHRLIGRPEHLAQLPEGAPAISFSFRCNSDVGLLAAIKSGVGIGYCQAPIGRRDHNLIEVLPEVILARLGIWVVTHEDLRAILRVRRLMEFLSDRLGAYIADADGASQRANPVKS